MGGRLGPLLIGAVFAGAGALVVVSDRRSHGQAVSPDTTRAALVEAGWTDLTAEVQADPEGRLPRPVVEALRIDRATSASGYDAVAELAGIHPSHVHAAGARTTSVRELRAGGSGGLEHGGEQRRASRPSPWPHGALRGEGDFGDERVARPTTA